MASRSPNAPIDISGQRLGITRTQTGGFVDENLNDWIVMNDTVNAVNALSVQNNVSGSPVILTVGGASPDTNASMTIAQLRTGTLTLGNTQGTLALLGATISFTGSISVTNLTASGWINTAGLTVTGNANFTGAAARIFMHTADTTLSNRVAFQESGLNSSMQLVVLPSGAATTSQFQAYNSSAPDNAGRISVAVNSVSAYIQSLATGSGTAVGLELQTNASPVFQAPVGGNVTVNSATNNIKIGINGTVGNVGSIEFANLTTTGLCSAITSATLPSGFSGLRMTLVGRTNQATTNSTISIRFNGDSGGNYDYNFIQNNNTSLTGVSASAQSQAQVGYVGGASVTRTSAGNPVKIEVPNYAGTVFEKSFLSSSVVADSTAASQFYTTGGGSWRNTAAITSVSVIPNSGSFVTSTNLIIELVN